LRGVVVARRRHRTHLTLDRLPPRPSNRPLLPGFSAPLAISENELLKIGSGFAPFGFGHIRVNELGGCFGECLR
jgi:hypothetical protein